MPNMTVPAARKLPIAGIRPQTGFDLAAHRIAETIEELWVAERPRDRRIALIRVWVRHAILHGYKAARRRDDTPDAQA
jgi:hypothetical protein